MSEAGSVTSTLNADSARFVEAYDKANLALQRSRAALAETKAAMVGAGGATDELKAKVKGLQDAMTVSQAALEKSKLGMMEFGKVAEKVSGEEGGGGLHSLARGMRFSASAALTMEGQVQHAGHAIVGMFMGMDDPLMLAAMGAGLALELIVKNMDTLKNAFDGGKTAMKAYVQAIDEEFLPIWEKIEQKVKDAEMAVATFGMNAGEKSHVMAADESGQAQEKLSEAKSSLAFVDSEITRVASLMSDVMHRNEMMALRGHQSFVTDRTTVAFREQLDSLKKQKVALQENEAGLQATVDKLDRVSSLTQHLGDLEREKETHDKLALANIEEIKKAREKAAAAAEKEAAFTERIANAVARIAVTPTSTSDLAEGFSKLQNPLESSPMRTTMGSPLGIDITHITEFEDVLDATSDQMKEFTGALDEGATVIYDKTQDWAALMMEEQDHAEQRLADLKAMSSEVGQIGSSIVQGHGGSAIGGQLGSVAGAGVGMLVGDPTGIAGGAIGGALGSMFGGVVDALAPMQTIGKQFMETLGVLAATLEPLMSPVMQLAQVFDQLVKMTAPLITYEMNALVPLLDVAVGVLEFIGAFGVLIYALNPFLDLTHLALRPLVTAAQGAATALMGFERGLFETVNQIVKFADSLGANLQQVDVNAAFGLDCFTARTLVWTPSGPREIQDLRVGDEVIGWDEETGEQRVCRVATVHSRLVDALMLLDLEDETIETTSEHPFWVAGSKFTEASAICDGDQLRTRENTWVRTAAPRARAGRVLVYNLSVDDCRTYFVGKTGVLVHNKDDKKAALAAAKEQAKEQAKNTTQLKRLNDNFNNLPAGYKIAGLLQAADAGVRQQINIQQVMVVARSGNLIEQIHRELVHRHGVNRGGGGGPEDDHN